MDYIPRLPLEKSLFFVGKHFDVGQDFDVPIQGFFIIGALRREVRSVADFTKSEEKEFISILCLLRKGMRDKLGIKAAYLFENEDTLHRFHVWVFPRYEWMEKYGTKIESVKPIMDYASKNMATKSDLAEVKKSMVVMEKYFLENIKLVEK